MNNYTIFTRPVSFRFNSCHAFLSFHLFVCLLLCVLACVFLQFRVKSEFAEVSGSRPCCFIYIYPCFQVPNTRHLVAMAPFCSYYFSVGGERERERCVGESKCALTAPSSSSFLPPPYSPPLSFPFRPLCSSIYLGCRGVMQTQWS